MKKLLFSFLALSTVVFTSCEDENKPLPEPPVKEKQMLPKKISFTATNEYVVYDYNPDYTVKGIKAFKNSSSTPIQEQELYYENGKLKQVVFVTQNITMDIEYNGNNASTILPNGQILTFVYNDKGQKIEEQADGETRVRFSYNAAGNIENMKIDNYSVDYTYDDKNGIFRNVKNLFWFQSAVVNTDFQIGYFLVNNIKELKAYQNDTNLLGVNVYNATYNAQNFPTSLKMHMTVYPNTPQEESFENEYIIEYIEM